MWKLTKMIVGAWIVLIPSTQLKSQEVDFSRVAVFGDSLCDTGNLFLFVNGGFPFSGPGQLFPTPPYDNGRFCNGPIWLEEFNEDLAYPAPVPFFANPFSFNFAFGGAETGNGLSQRETPNLGLQVGLFAQSFQTGFAGDELVVYWAGGNDFTPLPGMPLPTPQSVVANTKDRLTELIALGGTTFLVPNLPPLGSIPQVRELGPLAELLLNLTVLEHNILLEGVLRDLEADFGVRIYRIDIFSIVSTVSDQPGRFGFTNTTDAVFDLFSGEIIGDPDEYIYWDTIHPTSAAHQLFGSISASSLVTQRMLDYVSDSSADGLSIRRFFSAWFRASLSLQLSIANFQLQTADREAATQTLGDFQNLVARMAGQRRISQSDAGTLISQAQLAIDALADE